VNPMLGAISAYLYDYAGDVESIRRMAAFYIERRQPIPFEIALLGGFAVTIEDGDLFANVDAVPARADHPNGRLPRYVTAAMSGGVQAVAGLCPWLRQGWDLVDPDD